MGAVERTTSALFEFEFFAQCHSKVVDHIRIGNEGATEIYLKNWLPDFLAVEWKDDCLRFKGVDFNFPFVKEFFGFDKSFSQVITYYVNGCVIGVSCRMGMAEKF